MFYEVIFRAFNKKKIRYLVVGGLAVNLHGIPRMTQDLDVTAAMDTDNLQKIIECFFALGYKPRLPVKPEVLLDEKIRAEWIKKKNLKAFTFYHYKFFAQEVDIILVSPVNFEQAWKNRVLKNAGGVRIPLISIQDLITMKKSVERKVDISDVKMLKFLLKNKGAE